MYRYRAHYQNNQYIPSVTFLVIGRQISCNYGNHETILKLIFNDGLNNFLVTIDRHFSAALLSLACLPWQ